jgi:GT2 family glycosyltransferase
MIKVSAVIITYNEEQNIAKCIDSVRPVADEIIVLDCFSTDNTRQVAEERGAKFYQQEFMGFARQKNRAVELASYDCVLSLDADEYLSSELTQSILSVKTNWTHDGYLMNRLSSFEGTWIKTCGWYPDQKLRLWDRRKGVWVGDGVHEKVDLAAGASEKLISGDLFHRAYDNIYQFLQKNQSYSTIHAQVNRYRTSSSTFKIIYKTIFAFFKAYILKGGVLDGYKGLIVSGSTAHWVFYKYAKLLEANKSVKVSMIIESTENPEELAETLSAVKHLNDLPNEVIVNGKSAGSVRSMRGLSQNFPVPIRFLETTHEDSLQDSVGAASEEYIVVWKDSRVPYSALQAHKNKAWKGSLLSGGNATRSIKLGIVNPWSDLLGNGTVSFWKEDWQAENRREKAITELPARRLTPAEPETRGLSVVIPNFNGVSLFPQTLPSLFTALEKSGLPYEILISDDCSTDDSVKYLKENYPDIKVLTTTANGGFSPTINRGIRAARYELVFLLNSDVKLKEDYFTHLIPYFDKADTFGVMGQIINWDDDRIQDGAKLPTLQGAKIKTFKNFLPSETPVQAGVYTMYLSGAEALVNRDKLLQLGGFDEIFAPYYIEDYELSLRAWRLGWKCYYDHRAVCRHKTSSSIRSKSKKKHIQTIYYRNKMFLHAIHLSPFQLALYYPQLLFECLIRVASFRFHYVRSIVLFLHERDKWRASRRRFHELSQKVGRNLPLVEVADKIIRSLNRVMIWRF